MKMQAFCVSPFCNFKYDVMEVASLKYGFLDFVAVAICVPWAQQATQRRN
jgi:hypothetical protein